MPLKLPVPPINFGTLWHCCVYSAWVCYETYLWQHTVSFQYYQHAECGESTCWQQGRHWRVGRRLQPLLVKPHWFLIGSCSPLEFDCQAHLCHMPPHRAAPYKIALTKTCIQLYVLVSRMSPHQVASHNAASHTTCTQLYTTASKIGEQTSSEYRESVEQYTLNRMHATTHGGKEDLLQAASDQLEEPVGMLTMLCKREMVYS